MKDAELTVVQRAVLREIPKLGLRKGARVMDAPCGAAAALALELQALEFEVTGLDLDSEAKSRLGDAFQPADLNEPLPCSDQSFDAVFSTEGIEHLENHFQFFRELNRVLKPGGVLILTTPNIVALRSRVRFLGSGFFGRDSRPLDEAARHPLHHIGLGTFPELRYELLVCGFKLKNVRHTHIKPISYVYGILAPWVWLYTRIAFRKEKDAAQRERNREILSALCSRSVLFGECLLLISEKE
jgi:SAM-dependent methyltransferase